MRPMTLLAAATLTALAFAMPVSAATEVQDGPDVVSFGSPCLNGGTTLIVYGHTVLQCWKPVGAGSDALTETKCASEVCTLINQGCTIATKPVTKRECVLVA
jgi:hypothetical protein